MGTELPGIVAEHIAAVNAFDTERIVATFAPDAYVNDNRREIWGTDAIRAFMAKEFAGDHVTMDVREVIDHYGDICIAAAPISVAPVTRRTFPSSPIRTSAEEGPPVVPHQQQASPYQPATAGRDLDPADLPGLGHPHGCNEGAAVEKTLRVLEAATMQSAKRPRIINLSDISAIHVAQIRGSL
jgi:hypothetical protein